ncbi:MAG: FAD-binding oxidoreductase [Vicinamibacterales bacterium]
MALRTVRVRSIRGATPRTRIISLDLNGVSFPFQAGQAVMVGLHQSPLRKPYSIASAPIEVAESGAIDLLVQLEDSGGLDPHLELAATGTLLDVEGPFGSFGLPDRFSGSDLLFVAGGTGIAPLRSILVERLASTPPPTASVVYSARSADELVYRMEIESLARAARIRACLTVTRDESKAWSGRRGRIDRHLLVEALPSNEAFCLLCGPPQLLSETRVWLRELGVRDDLILTETF